MRAAERAPVVLCVDDETSIRNALRRVFLDDGWELHFADCGESGLKVIREREVDLVLSDFRMPGMDGVEFLKAVKEIRPDCMRIVLSGYADIKLIVSALNEGEVYRFIAKPWNEGELQHNIRKALDHHRADRENRRLAEELRRLNADLERKVEERTRELIEKNRSLRFAQVVLELLPMPVIAVNAVCIVVFANAKARDLLAAGGPELVGHPAPQIFEPELTGAVLRAHRGGTPSRDGADRVLPMVLDGEPVGAIILTHDEDPLDLELIDPRKAFAWSVMPI